MQLYTHAIYAGEQNRMSFFICCVIFSLALPPLEFIELFHSAHKKKSKSHLCVEKCTK